METCRNSVTDFVKPIKINRMNYCEINRLTRLKTDLTTRRSKLIREAEKETISINPDIAAVNREILEVNELLRKEYNKLYQAA